MLEKSEQAQVAWSKLPVQERLDILSRWVNHFAKSREEVAQELTMIMGRPIAESPKEVDEFVKRSQRVLDLVPELLERFDERTQGSLEHYVQREAMGVVFVRAGWNYPYIIAAHSVVPALAVGNSVLLKHSGQTPHCSARLEKAFAEVGGPPGVLQALRLDRQTTERLGNHKRVRQVALTGALPNIGNRPVLQKRRHVGLGLDLGGKDPAYVRADANVEMAVSSLLKAAFSNAGQSCCGVEKIYVESTIFDQFVEAFKAAVESLKLGDPREADTTLGPMVRFQAAMAVYDQVNATIRQGATPLFPNLPPDRAYFHPQILVDVDHSMKLMSQETFGPAVGVMKVNDDDQAVELMNDTQYALGASVWTQDVSKGVEIVQRVHTATSYVNNCDYLDPAIAFLGVNGAPRGFTLSHFGFEMLTLARSYWVNDPKGHENGK